MLPSIDHLGLEEEEKKEMGWLASTPAEDRAASSIGFEDGKELNTCVLCFMATCGWRSWRRRRRQEGVRLLHRQPEF